MSKITPYLHQVMTFAPRTGHDAYGDPSFGTAVQAAVRSQPTTRLVRNQQGHLVAADLTVWAEPWLVVSVGDQATYNGVTYEVMAVVAQWDFEALDHYEITLARK